MGQAQSKCMDTEMIYCACGCGNKMPRYDKQGRLRKYIYGHFKGNFRAHYRFHNPIVECACGCGEKMHLYSNKGKARKYIEGHHRRKIGDLSVVLGAIKNNGTPRQASKSIELSNSAIRTLLKRNRLIYKTDLTKVGGNTAFGRKAELDALKLLDGSIDCNGNNPKESPFDILWNGLRIDVKASTIKNSKGYMRWAFKTEKQYKCDMFLCIGYNNDQEIEVILLIPSKIIPSSLSIPIHLKSRWAKYLFWQNQ